MPTLRQLEYLVAVAETLHFRRAAERVHTTQPTLSEQLKALEERLGVKLIERSKKTIFFTPIGQQIVKIARRMLTDANEMRVVAARGQKGFAGVIKLGIPPSVGPYLMPKLIPHLQHDYEDLKFYIRESIPSGLMQELQEGRYDLVISLLPVRHAELHALPLLEEPLFLALRQNHPLAAREEVEWEDLSGTDVLTLGEGHQLHEAVKKLCAQVGLNLRADYEGTSLDTLREMVAMNLGVTFLPGLYVKSIAEWDTSLKIVKIKGENLSRTIGMIWRKTSASHEQYCKLADTMVKKISKHFPSF